MIHHRRTSALIAHRGYRILRLVERQINQRINECNLLTVHKDTVASGHQGGRKRGDTHSIDGNAPFGNQIFRFSPGSDAAHGEVAIDAHFLLCLAGFPRTGRINRNGMWCHMGFPLVRWCAALGNICSPGRRLVLPHVPSR